MTRNAVVAMVIGVTAIVGGCQRLNYGQQVAPLPAIPAQPVASGNALQPLVLAPDPSQPAATGLDANQGDPAIAGEQVDGQQVAAVQPLGAEANPPAGAAQLGRTELLGGWTVSSAGDSCKLFMNLTTWSGGYRASTRGCSAGAMAQIAAWDLNGSQVVLKDASGATLAHLYKSASERFNGQTSTGQPISVFR